MSESPRMSIYLFFIFKLNWVLKNFYISMFDSFNYRIRTLTHASGITHGCFSLLENKLSLETSNDWVLISFIDKISYCQIKYLSSNPTYQKKKKKPINLLA